MVLNYYQDLVGCKNITILSLSMGSITTVIGLEKNNKSNNFDLIFEGAVYDYYMIAYGLAMTLRADYVPHYFMLNLFECIIILYIFSLYL